MKKPYLSIIIPAYKAEKSLPLLLDSIFATSGFSDFEILVMDDHSPDGTREIAQAYGSKIRYVSLKRNGGPAKARNEGARIAKGKILLFLDSDVVCFSDTVARVGKAFLNDPDLTALTGVWVRPKKTSRFFANYKALRDWSYWINERQVKGYYYLFSTRIAAVKRDVFLRLGGFNEAYKGADIEDIEFTYRIASRYAVLFDEKIRVKHEFEDFGPVAKKYFRRSFFWSQLFSERKKFDPVAMTISETITGLGAVLSLFFFLLSFVYHPFLFLAFFCLLLNLWGTRKFLIYTFKEEGTLFAFKSFWISYLLYFVIYLGAAVAVLSLVLRGIFGKKAAHHFNLAISEMAR